MTQCHAPISVVTNAIRASLRKPIGHRLNDTLMICRDYPCYPAHIVVTLVFNSTIFPVNVYREEYILISVMLILKLTGLGRLLC